MKELFWTKRLVHNFSLKQKTMKKIFCMLPVAALAVLTSCNRDELPLGSADPANVIAVTTEIIPIHSRAGYTTETLREFGLIIDSGKEDWTYNNRRVTGGALEGWTTDGQMYWSNRKEEHTVIAYAPYREGELTSASVIGVNVLPDQSDADGVLASDFLAMKKPSYIPENDMVDGKLLVAMNHMLSKVFVRISYPEAYAASDSNPVSNLSVEGMIVNAMFNLGEWDGTVPTTSLFLNPNGAEETILPNLLSHDPSAREVVYEFISVPQEQGKIKISFVAGGTSYTWSYDNLKLNSGESLTIILSVDKEGVQLGDTTVGDWTTVTDINGGNPEENPEVYKVEEITAEKSGWSVLYGTPSMPFGVYGELFNNNPDNSEGGWFSHILDGYDGSRNIGNPFCVIDLGKSTWLAGLGIVTSFHDVMPNYVDFYITESTEIEDFLTAEEHGSINCTSGTNGDAYVNSEAFDGVLARIREVDNGVTWTKIGRIEVPALAQEYGRKEYRLDFDEEKLGSELKSRYLRIELTPFAKGSFDPQGDRTKISELLVKKVARYNGVVVE